MADLQSLIAAGLSPQDAASLLADLQRYETQGVPNMNLGVAPQSTMVDGVEYQNQYGGMDIIPGMTSGILANLGIENPQLPVYRIAEAQAQKNANDARQMSFMPTPGSAYRLVDNATGEVVMSATTPEEYAALAQRANELAASEGKRANFEIQRQDPQSIGGGFTPIYSDTPDVAFDTTAQLLAAGMLAMTGAGLLQPGGLGGVGAGATGAGVGTGTGIGAGAGLGGSVAAPSLAASTLAPLAAEAGTILVTAPAAAAGLGTIAPIAAGTAATGGILASTGGVGAQPAPQSPANAAAAPDEIVVTAQNSNPFAIPPIAPVAAGTGLTAGILAGAQPTALPEVGPMDTPQKPGLLSNITKNLGISDYMTLASLVGSGVGSLFGGGGTGTQAPYVSPFGPIGGIGAGQDMRANPNIADYEQYGFGPEATFFKPEYNQLVSSTFQPTTQAYKPLING